MRIAIALVLVFVLVLLAAGCGSPCTQVKSTRCAGPVVEICGSNSRWMRVMSCAEVAPLNQLAPKTWVCGETTTGHTCIPRATP